MSQSAQSKKDLLLSIFRPYLINQIHRHRFKTIPYVPNAKQNNWDTIIYQESFSNILDSTSSENIEQCLKFYVYYFYDAVHTLLWAERENYEKETWRQWSFFRQIEFGFHPDRSSSSEGLELWVKKVVENRRFLWQGLMKEVSADIMAKSPYLTTIHKYLNQNPVNFLWYGKNMDGSIREDNFFIEITQRYHRWNEFLDFALKIK